MHVTIQRPTLATIAAHLRRQATLEPTFVQAGCTAHWTLATIGGRARQDGFDIDYRRVKLGEGDAAFESAKRGLSAWKMFPQSWTWVGDTCGTPPAMTTGNHVAVLVRYLGCWWFNAARIAYCIDEPTRFGFAYVTLPSHSECGEERFLVEMDVERRVWYDLSAISRPQSRLAKLGYPLVRRAQRRFSVASTRAMAQHVQETRA